MIEISMKGEQWYYFPRGAAIPATINAKGIEWKVDLGSAEEIMQKYISETDDMRFVLTLGVPDWKNVEIYQLYWYKNAGANEADKKLLEGDFNPDLFDETVVLEYMHLTCLRGCGSWWHVLLIPVLLRLVPHDIDSKRFGKDIFFQDCPNCHRELPKGVLKIIGPAESPYTAEEIEEAGNKIRRTLTDHGLLPNTDEE